MAKVKLTIEFEYDPAQNNGMPVNNFLYHYLTRFNRQYPITGVEYKGAKQSFTVEDDLNGLVLKEADSLKEADRPEKPDMRNVTKIAPGILKGGMHAEVINE